MKKIALILSLIFLFSASCLSQWQTDVRLTFNSVFSFTSDNNAWCISAEGTNLHVVWYDGRDLNSEIYYKRSTNNGATWSADTRLTNESHTSELPSITTYDRYVHVVWTDDRNGNGEIYYKRSSDRGLTWGTDTRLTYDSYGSRSPSIAKNGFTIHVVWHDGRDGNAEIYYKRSTDNGITWGADTRLSNGASQSWYPSIAVWGSFVHVVCQDERNGLPEIYYKRSTDGGSSWGLDIRLTNEPSQSTVPCVAVSGQYVHVVWFDNRSSLQDLWYKRSTDGGINWGADTHLETDPHQSIYPSIAVSGSNVHIVWRDLRPDNISRIYYKHSTNRGINWDPDLCLTNSTTGAEDPSVAVWGTNVHVVWNDRRDGPAGNWEVYYKQNPTGNPWLIFKPGNLSARSLITGTIGLNWADSSNNEDGFKIERSTDAGQNWILRDSIGRNIVAYSDTGLSPNKIYYYRVYAYNQWDISDYSNVAYDTTLSPIGIISQNGEVPKEYGLRNYPNPFNPATNIEFSLPKTKHVSLKIYDLFGKLAEVLINNELKVPGRYSFAFDGSNLSSGIYFCRLETDDFTETRKMLLIK